MPFSISELQSKLRAVVDSASESALPLPSEILKATGTLPSQLPSIGQGEEAVEKHLLSDITPGFNGPKTSANYYGFVTGGVFPIAAFADNVVTAFDQNVQVHLPDQSISTTIEDRASSMLAELLNLGEGWEGRTFTTGATGANILGLACGRESVINSCLEQTVGEDGVGELGLLAACQEAEIKQIQVLTTMGHSSLSKAASVVGLGRRSVKDVSSNNEEPWKLDLGLLQRELERSSEGVMSIVSVSAGEVNTGRFAVDGLENMKKVRKLCDKYGAWLHVDGAFGLFARALPATPEFATLIKQASGLELADSITGDCHKMLNVPYDCGFFFTRSSKTLTSVFGNPNAAYLSTGVSTIPSPLNIGLENSRRFRALPVYAVLLAHGRDGLAEMFARQVRLARGVSKYLQESEVYELLPSPVQTKAQPSVSDGSFEGVHIIVLFRAMDDKINSELVKRINATRRMYVSGTSWEGKPASRIAISTWKVDVKRDMKLVTEVLGEVLKHP